MPRTGNEKLDVAELYESLMWVLPAINPGIGQIEPPARYKRTGLIAYADGTNWNPNSQGRGHYRWDGAAWVKFLEPDDTFTTSIDADKVDGKHFSDFPFTKSYESSEQTITAAGGLQLEHSFGVEPKIVFAMLVCKTAEASYSIGDKPIAPIGDMNDAAQDKGVSVWCDSTYINARFGLDASTFKILDKTSGSFVSLTNANWKIVFRAWA